MNILWAVKQVKYEIQKVMHRMDENFGFTLVAEKMI